MDSDELATYEPTEEDLALYYISYMVDTLLEQIQWLKAVIEEELDREAEESNIMAEEKTGKTLVEINNNALEIPDGFVPLKEAACHYYIAPGMIRQLALEHRSIPFFWDGERVLVRVADLVKFFEYLFSDILPELDQHAYFFEDEFDDEGRAARMENFAKEQDKEN